MQCESEYASVVLPQVAELLQEKAALQKQNTQHAKRLESLDTNLASLQADRDALARQLTEDNNRPKERLKDVQPSHNQTQTSE